MKLKFIRETDLARLYENAGGQQLWIPRSVMTNTLKWPAKDGQRPIHELEVEEWWLEKNPWPEVAVVHTQPELLK